MPLSVIATLVGNALRGALPLFALWAVFRGLWLRRRPGPAGSPEK